MTKRYYAQVDSMADGKETPSWGFANNKSVKVFYSMTERDAWLKSTSDLSAKKLTRSKAFKLAGHCVSEYHECICSICRPDLH